MPETNLFLLFVERFDRLGVPCMVSGSVASIVYGEPRLTHGVDIIVELAPAAVDALAQAFPPTESYFPPKEVIAVELRRRQRGHFNIIHHSTRFKADVYAAGMEEIHAWALAQARTLLLEKVPVGVAPPEYVILRKLEFYREGRSERHLRDIGAMLALSGDTLDRVKLDRRIRSRALEPEWKLACSEGGTGAE